MRKLINKNKFLFVYGLIVLIALVLILFVLDDKYFVNKTEEKIKTKEVPTKSPSYNDQLKQLLNKKYNYHYNLNYNGVTYKCQGNRDKEEEKGTCSKPKNIEYSNENYQEVFKNINTDYLDVEYIYKEIKDIKPEVTKLDVKSYYTYNVNILNLKGEIVIFSDSKRITQITIANGYLTYVLYFDSIN